MRIIAFWSGLLAAILSCGCARGRVTTAIKADGSWVRTLALTGQDKKAEMQMTPTLDDTFVVPTGAGWKSREEKKGEERTLILERTLAAGGSLHPDLAERRISARIGWVLLKAREEQFGDKMTAAERREVARKLIATSFSTTKPSQPDPSSGPPSSKGSALTPLMFIVKAPGRVVSSNGEVDELTGEVYWALFSDAASLKDVVLTAIVE